MLIALRFAYVFIFTYSKSIGNWEMFVYLAHKSDTKRKGNFFVGRNDE